MKLFKSILAIFAVLLILPSLVFPTALVNVPLEDWSYQFIQRLQTKGILKEHLSNSKPYSRSEMAKMIIYISQLEENGRLKLTKVESSLLNEMKKEFTDELEELGLSGLTKGKKLVDWADGDLRLIGQMKLAQDIILNPEDNKFRSTLGFSFYGDILKYISFYNYSRASYEPEKEYPVTKQKQLDPRYYQFRVGWSALSDAYFVLGNSKVNLQAGKDTILWGPGYHGVIGLSGIEPSFDLIRLRAKMWIVNFTSALGFLRDDLTKEHRSDVPEKYLAAHRFEILPYPGVCIGWQEVYIYAEKLNFQFLNPIMPYQMAEDYYGDIGNNTMEGDIEITLIPGVKIYSALFLDDFHTDVNPFTYPGWGWAILGGAMMADPLGVKNTRVILEYARVDPWTYIHKGTHQDPPIPTAYKHFDESLGHWIGPNADDLFAEIGWYINKNLYSKIIYNRIRKGEIGSNMYDVPDYKDVKKFLEGIVQTKNEFGIGLKYTTFGKFDIDLDYRYIKTKNKQKDEAFLPKSDSRKQPWKTGWNTTENEVQISLKFKY